MVLIRKLLDEDMRKVVNAEDALDPAKKKPSLKESLYWSFINVFGHVRCSPAEDCKRVLDSESGEGVKADMKMEKRETGESRTGSIGILYL